MGPSSIGSGYLCLIPNTHTPLPFWAFARCLLGRQGGNGSEGGTVFGSPPAQSLPASLL